MGLPTFNGGTGGGTLFRKIVHTDADGNFTVSAQFDYIPWGITVLPQMSPTFQWRIAIIKNGYAVEGDEVAWQFDEYGRPKFWPMSLKEEPTNRWLVFRSEIAPIRMRAVGLSTKELAVYDQFLLSAATTHRMPDDFEEAALTRSLYALFLPRVCEASASEPIDLPEVGALEAMTPNPELFRASLVTAGYRVWDEWSRAVFKTEHVCSAMKAGG